MFIALTVYACTTETDFTLCGGVMFVALSVFCIGGIFIFFVNGNVANIIYSCIGVVIFSIYIVYDT